MSRTHSPTITLSVAVAAALAMAVSGTAHAGAAFSQTMTSGDYSINLKLLPAEPFVSPSEAHDPAHAGAMVNGGGAPPIRKQGVEHPNHHLVVFVRKDGKPVEHGDVKISYHRTDHSGGPMVQEPVTRMWVAGAGPKTTHYGNNVYLTPGTYQVKVVVNGSAQASFQVPVK